MRTWARLTVAVAGVFGLGFLAGRAGAPTLPAIPEAAQVSSSPQRPRQVPAPDVKAQACPPCVQSGEVVRPAQPPQESMVPRLVPGGIAGACDPCEHALAQMKQQLEGAERLRKANEGEPIAKRSNGPPRLTEAGLAQALNRAIGLTKLPARLESVDCTEHPCILFGRVQGDEAAVAALEDSAAFAQYDSDVGVMLTWASGDHERGDPAKPGGDRSKPGEISLFAFAFYTAQDKAEHGEAIDRRIRVRTAEYWNASRPVE